jgi:vacuolar-type H+-ATPase subunit E/Vma4
MPIDQIRESIIARRDSEIESLKAKFRAELVAFNSRADKQKSELDLAYKKKIDDDTRALVKRTVDSATLEARQIVNSRIGELLNRGLATMTEQLKDLRKSPEYHDILNQMVKAARRMFGDNCTILVRHEDASGISGAGSIKILESELDGVGGIIARSIDSKVELNLTMTALFKDIRENLMQEIYSRIR